MKENTENGKSLLSVGTIFFAVILAMSLFTVLDRTVPVRAATVKKQQTVKLSTTKSSDRWKTLLQKYQKNKKVNQLIFVKYRGNSKADVILYNRKNGKLTKALQCAAYVGKNGINKKKEGDKKTPTGTYSFTKAFGIKKNPGSKMKYIKLNKYYYWSGDRRYYKPHYNYALALDYNKKCVYKKGSAIFLHCTGSKKYTGGCVAVKEKYMKKIIQMVDKNAKICIYPR